MKILLSNDDGVFAPGLKALANALNKDHELTVSAPDSERSAVSRSMTLFDPLRARETRIEGLPDVPAYAVSGTPVDCVRLALGNLFSEPDIVVSGINMGPNLGTDVLYSGTVAAAHEAALLGYQSIAVSCLSYHGRNIETAARLLGMPPVDFPQETAVGALAVYVSGGSVGDFQPMNVNFGIITPLDHRVRGKRNKNAELSQRSLEILEGIKQEVLWT